MLLLVYRIVTKGIRFISWRVLFIAAAVHRVVPLQMQQDLVVVVWNNSVSHYGYSNEHQNE